MIAILIVTLNPLLEITTNPLGSWAIMAVDLATLIVVIGLQ